MALLPSSQAQFLDNQGVPLAGGAVYTYVPSTTTLKACWLDSGLTTVNANPIVLDAGGRCYLYGSGQYLIVVQDKFGNTITTMP